MRDIHPHDCGRGISTSPVARRRSPCRHAALSSARAGVIQVNNWTAHARDLSLGATLRGAWGELAANGSIIGWPVLVPLSTNLYG